MLLTVTLSTSVGALLGELARRLTGTGWYRRDDEGPAPAPTWMPTLTAAAAAALAYKWHTDLLALGVYLAGLPILAHLAAVDLHVRRLPRVLTGLYLALSASGLLLLAVVHRNPTGLAIAALGAALYWGLLAGLRAYSRYLNRRRARAAGGDDSTARADIGGGDLALAQGLGLTAGWCGISTLVYAAALANLVALPAALLLLARGAGRRTHLPFGPFMILGWLLALVVT